VTANDDGTYDWTLDGQSKSNPAQGFLTVISGHAVPDEQPGDHVHRGTGEFTIDFDAGELVNPVDNTPDTGNVLVTYDLAERVVTMHAEGADALGNPGSWDYYYAENADRSGDVQFALDADIDESGSLREQALIRSRWQADGQGRADAMVSGGDLGDLTVTATECWDAQFRRVFYGDSGEWLPTEGDAASCTYTEAALPEIGN